MICPSRSICRKAIPVSLIQRSASSVIPCPGGQHRIPDGREAVKALKRIRAGGQRPHAHNCGALTALAVQHARAQLAAACIEAPRDGAAAMHAFLNTRSASMPEVD